MKMKNEGVEHYINELIYDILENATSLNGVSNLVNLIKKYEFEIYNCNNKRYFYTITYIFFDELKELIRMNSQIAENKRLYYIHSIVLTLADLLKIKITVELCIWASNEMGI